MSDETKQGPQEAEATGNPAQPAQGLGATAKDERSGRAEERERTKRADQEAAPGLGFSIKGGPDSEGEDSSS